MQFIPRSLTVTIKKAMKTFPAIVITGPRQSGKTTLLKNMFSDTHQFVSLEDPDIRIRAKEDPRGFLDQYSDPVIVDEIQYVPELLSYIKTRIDENRIPGRWLFTGSQNFALMEGISQSLAGRAAVLTLLPLAISEIKQTPKNISHFWKNVSALPSPKTFKRSLSTPEIILRGSYPEVNANLNVDRQLWSGSYINTYIERDIRNLRLINDLRQFDQFVHLCASRTGQILNISELARDIGISVPTAKQWLSLLIAGNQVFLLPPYYRNIGKRMIKSPKLYFMDTGLCTYLMGIHKNETLINGPTYGAIFETLVIMDLLKSFYNNGQKPSLYYLRTPDGMEIDLIIEFENKLNFFEIKSGRTIYPKHAGALQRVSQLKNIETGLKALISDTDENFILNKDIVNINWEAALS